MRIAICDDEQEFINHFKRIMHKLYNSLDIITDEFSDGGELLKSYKFRAYDIVFLDIEMPGMDGITIARKIREVDEDACIVFLTGHVEYAIKGYEVNALRYLTKPAEEDKVREVVEHMLKKRDEIRSIWVHTADGDMRIKLGDIFFFEAQNQNVVINTAEESFSVRGNISDYEKKLSSDGFFRTHRGYLISLDKVYKVTDKAVILEDGTKLPVSRNKEAQLKRVIFSYVNREAF